MELTQKQFDVARQKIEKYLYHATAPQEQPTAILVVAQPGSGKTSLVSFLRKNTQASFINADEYRRYFPGYKKLYDQYGDRVIEMTKTFSGKMTEALIDRLSDRRSNLIIEGTLRTTEVPNKTRELLEKKEYRVELAVLLVRPEVSWLRTLRRYHRMREEGTTPRHTAKQHHDQVVAAIPSNLRDIYKAKVFSEIKIYKEINEKYCIIYSLNRSPEKDPSQIVRRAFSRKFSEKEIAALKKEYGKYLSRKDFASLFAAKYKGPQQQKGNKEI